MSSVRFRHYRTGSPHRALIGYISTERFNLLMSIVADTMSLSGGVFITPLLNYFHGRELTAGSVNKLVYLLFRLPWLPFNHTRFGFVRRISN